MFVAIFKIVCSTSVPGSTIGQNGFLFLICFLHASTTALANSIAPFPPFSWPSNITTSTAPNSLASSFIAFISATVSDENLFIDTTTGISVVAKFKIWRLKIGRCASAYCIYIF